MKRWRHPAFRVWSALLLGFVLALPNPSRAQDTCDVVIALDESAPMPVVAYGLDYTGAGGSFLGTGFAPTCTKLFVGVENTIYDDDAGLLSNFVASFVGSPPTQALISCVFALDSGFPCPAPSAFVVTDPEFPPIGGGITLPPPPALSIIVTARTPVCGDGFQEGTEQCDDGNVVDGDCCSSSCVQAAAGTACTDGSVCTLSASCDSAGTCVPETTLDCADSDPCTTDSCDALLGCGSASVPAPHTQCEYHHRGTIDLRDGATDAKNKLQWLGNFRSVDATPAEVGNPTVDTDYAFCIYDEVAEVASLVARIDVPAGANSEAVGPTGIRYQYKDSTHSVNGVERLRIDGKPDNLKLQLKAAGANLVLPGPVAPDRYFANDERVRVQLRNTVGGCWSMDFTGTIENSATRYRAKHH